MAKLSPVSNIYHGRLLLTVSDCAAEQEGLCQNGAAVTSDCKCQCEMGWMGDTCSGGWMGLWVGGWVYGWVCGHVGGMIGECADILVC